MAEAKEFYVATEIFYVATGFHRVVSRQSVLCHDLVGQGNETSCRDRRVLCRDKVWLGQEFSYRDRSVLSHDRVWPGHEFSFRDIMFLCRDRVDNGREALCHDRIFYVTTELATIESSVAHDRAGCARLVRTTVWIYDFVATEEARHERQTLGVHDRGVLTR